MGLRRDESVRKDRCSARKQDCETDGVMRVTEVEGEDGGPETGSVSRSREEGSWLVEDPPTMMAEEGGTKELSAASTAEERVDTVVLNREKECLISSGR